MASLNKAMIIGNLGKDPENRATTTGQSVATYSLATSEKFKNKNGEKEEHTELHNIVLWGKFADILYGRVMKLLLLLIGILLVPFPARAEKIGDVSTEFIMTGPNSKIVIEAFDDPLVPGVTCHVSYPTKGGVKGALGLVEERSEASIACRQIGPISIPANLKDGDEVFSKGRSILFKKLHVVRFLDKKRNVLVYLAFTDKLVDGSPKHSISSVPIMTWNR